MGCSRRQRRIDDGDSNEPREFSQSNLLARPRTLEELGRRSADRHGELGEDGQIDRLVLNLLHEGQTLGRVADHLTEKHPTRFDTWEKALGRVGDVSDRYRMTGNR